MGKPLFLYRMPSLVSVAQLTRNCLATVDQVNHFLVQIKQKASGKTEAAKVAIGEAAVVYSLELVIIIASLALTMR